MMALLWVNWGFGQTTIFTETMGTSPSTTLIPAYETANSFDNDSYTMSGSGDLRNTSASSGYTGSSGLANVFLTNTAGKNFQIAGINSISYTSITLSFGVLSTVANNMVTVEYSTDGSVYTALTVNSSITANTWTLKTASGTIPASATLYLRWTQPGTTAQFRIDDIKLSGTVSCSAPTITLGSNPSICSGVTSANLTYSAITNSPDKYSIVWSAAAITAGFSNVTSVALPGTPIVLTVPGAAAASTYSGNLTVTNTSTSCTSIPYPITATIVSSATSIAPTGTQNIAVSANGATLTVTEGSTPTSRIWKYGTSAGSHPTSTGNTTTTYTPNFGSAGTYYVICESTYPSPCGVVTSNEVQINVTANSIALTTSPQNFGPFCNATANSVNLTYNITGTVTSPFIELSNSSGSFASGTSNLGGSVTGAGPYTITTNIPISQVAGTYRIRVKSTDATPVISADNGSNITVTAAITPTISISTGSACVGTVLTFTATITNGGATPTYTWKKNTVTVGGNSSTYSPVAGTDVNNGDQVYCILTSNASCVSSATANSNTITVSTVNIVPDAVTVSGAGTFCGSATLTASGGANGTIYWQSTTNNGVLTSTASSSQIVYSSGTYYFRSYSGSCWGTQGSATITINTTPSITAQPSPQTVTTPATATFNVTASNAGGYQWQINTGSGWTNVTTGTGGTTASYTTEATTTGMSGYQYQCIVSGNAPCVSVTSNAVALTVNTGPISMFTFSAADLPTAYLSPTTVPANTTVSDMGISAGTITTNVTTAGLPNPPYIKSTGGWTATDQASSKYFYFTITPVSGYELSITGISFNAYASSAGPSAFSFDIDNGAATYTIDAPSASLVNVNQTVSGVTGKTSAVTIKIQGWLNGSRTSTGGGDFRLDDVSISGTVISSASQITVSPSSLSGLNYNYGSGPSTAQNYTLSGTGLSPAAGNITVTPPANFQISVDGGANYYSTAQTVAYTGSTLANTTIKVRLTAGLNSGNYTGNVVNSGGGAGSKNVAVSGWVIKPEPTSNVTNFNCSAGTTVSIPLTWTDATGATTPDGYLIMWSNTAYPSDPGTLADGTAVANSPGSGSGSLSVAAGVGAANITGLSSATQYYFRIWSYTNSGSYINYKLGSAPTSTCATLSAPCASNGFEGGINGASTGGTWTLPGGGAFVTNNVTYAHSGTWWSSCNSASDYIQSPLLTNPQAISFWARGLSTNDSYTVKIQSSTDINFGSGVTDHGTFVANGTNTGDITNAYALYNITLGLAGNYYVRFNMTARTAGQIYIDDVDIYCNSVTPGIAITTPVISAGNVEQNNDNLIIYKTTITSSITYAALQSAVFDLTGNYVAATLKTNPFKLWYSATDDFATKTQIGTAQAYVATGSSVTFSSLNTSIVGAGTGTGYLWLTADIACDALVTKTIGVGAANNADFTFTNANFTTTGPYTAGGTQTVIAASTIANVTGLGATTENNGTTSVSWTNPACLDELIIVVNTGGHISGIPSGTYTASSLSFTDGSNPAFPGGGVVVYNSTSPASPKVVTSLTAGTTYHVKVFTRKGSVWSSGVEVDVTPTAKAEPTENPTAFTCGVSNTSSIPFSWTVAGGIVTPDKYLIKWSTIGLGSISAPVDGTFEVDGVNAVNISHPTNTYTLTGLSTNTTVYFKIWSYTNAGTSVNYKTDGTTLTGTCSTQPDACVSESFESSFPPIDWTNSGAFQKTSGTICAGTKMVGFNAVGDYLITPVLNNPNLLTFQYKRSSSTASWTLKIQSAASLSGPWTDITSLSAPADELCHSFSYNLGISGSVYLRFLDARTSGGTEERYVDDINVYCVTTICTAPTTDASNFTTANVTGNSMNLSWTSGNGDNRIVVIKEGSSVDFVPDNGHNYTASADYSAAADLIPAGNRVVYNGSGTSVSVVGLTGGTTYYYKIFEYKCANGSQAYYTSGTPSSTSNITLPAPVTDLAVSCISGGSATITWTAPEGNYDGVVIGVRQGSTCEAISGNASSYTANTVFGSGTIINTATRTVYNAYSGSSGTSASVTVSNLTTAPYYIMAYTYKGSTGSAWSAAPQPTVSIVSGVMPVTSVQAAPMNASAQVIWTNPTSGCYSQIMVVANPTSATSTTPSGSSYTADASFTGTGTVFGTSGKVVYLGTGTSVTVTGLTNGTQYCFTVFVWNGSAWSAGISDCTTPIAGATVLVPGDVAVLGVNSNIYDCGGTSPGDDEISIVFFKPITTGTTIDMTDNGWDRCDQTPEKWGNAEGYMRIRRTGGPIAAGTVITFRFLNLSPYFEVISPDNNWVIDIKEGPLVFNTNGDQIYFMQGGTWNQGTTGGNNATYTGGTLLFAFNTNDDWTPHICSANNVPAGTGRSQNSGLVFGMDCFNMVPMAATDYLKYVGDLSVKSQRDWIAYLKDPDNWNAYSGCAAYDAGLPNYLVTTSIPISTSGSSYVPGLWTGAGGTTDWFYCGNWDNLRVPDSTVNVELPSTGVQNSCNIGEPGWIGHPSEHYSKASCLELKNNLSGYTFDLNHVSAKLDIWGNYINNSAFNQTAGLVTFKGATAQTISGTSLPTFYNITLNNSSGLTLYTDINVKGTITLLSGKLTTQSVYKIDLRTDGTIVENTPNNLAPTSYVTGNVKATRSIGAGTQSFGGLGLDITTGVSTSAEVIRTTGTSILVGSSGASIKRYFDITPVTNTGLNATLVFHYFDHEIADYLPEADLQMWKSPDPYTTWYLQTATITEADNISTKTGIPDFSRWTLAPKTKPLPIELLGFEAVCDDNNVDLSWSTSSESNNDYFTIEKSQDAIKWYIVGNIAGSGNSNALKHYSYTDNANDSKNIYYRLKQTDYNGEFEYFEPISVSCDDIYSSLNLYPNPANDQVICSVYFSEETSVLIEISNYLGQKILNKTFVSEKGYDNIPIDISSFESGIYIVSVRSSNGKIMESKQLVVQ